MISSIEVGRNVPNDINVIIEIPANGEAVKYEFDKHANMLMVDRFMATTMRYPCNYGFIPNTLSEDGDPTDVLVVTPVKLMPGVFINCRPLGMLEMTDESGVDAKIIAVPTSKLTTIYDDIKNINDLPTLLLDQIKHFFEHYKDLEPNKWVKVNGFGNLETAQKNIKASVQRYKENTNA